VLHVLDLLSILLHIPKYKNIFEDIFSAILYQLSPKSVTRVTLLNVRLKVALLPIFLLLFFLKHGIPGSSEFSPDPLFCAH